MIQLIYDRTESDVLLENEKGQYGFSDLNRVENAVADLSVLAQSLDVKFDPIVKTDWGLPGTFSSDEWPTKPQMTRYLHNVSQLCNSLEVAANVPTSMENLDWNGANQIENALKLVYERIQNVMQAFRYSGEIFAGEEYGL